MYEIQYMTDGKKELYTTKKEWNERIGLMIECGYDAIIEPSSHVALIDDRLFGWEEDSLYWE